MTIEALDQLLAPLPEVMGPRDVADVLGVTEPVIRQWLREGDLVGYRVGKSWRVLKSELRAYLISHRNQDVDGTPRRLED